MQSRPASRGDRLVQSRSSIKANNSPMTKDENPVARHERLHSRNQYPDELTSSRDKKAELSLTGRSARDQARGWQRHIAARLLVGNSTEIRAQGARWFVT